MELTLEQAKFKRRAIKGTCTRFKNQFDQLDLANVGLGELKTRQEKLSNYWNNFDEIQSYIEHLEDAAYADEAAKIACGEAAEQERNNFEGAFYELMGRLVQVIDIKQQRGGRTSVGSVQPEIPINHVVMPNAENAIKLPPMNIPTFSGSYDTWRSFRDSFKSLVHQNNHLTKVQKFHHLKSSLRFPASDIVQSFDVCDDNYDEAWALLEDRYNNEKWIIEGHLKALFESPSVKRQSAESLRQLHDSVMKNLRALKSLERPVDQWDDLIVHLIISKLDTRTLELWELNRSNDEFPKLKELADFILKQCRSLECVQKHNEAPSTNVKDKRFEGKTSASHVSTTGLSCPKCRGPHLPFECNEFRNIPVNDRFRLIREARICTNCLRTTKHVAKGCNGGSCRKCNKNHHTLLHFERADTREETLSSNQNNTEVSVASTVNCHTNCSSATLLSTAVLEISDYNGRWLSCVALLDNGSQSNFISRSLAARLKLPLKQTDVAITGIGTDTLKAKQRAEVTIKSRLNAFSSELNCLVIEKITEQLPQTSLRLDNFSTSRNIKLANPNFHTPSNIELLIGADTFYKLLCVGQIREKGEEIIYQKTLLGWIVTGKITSSSTITQRGQTSCNLATLGSLEERVSKFWELDSIPDKPQPSKDESMCERQFANTTQRDDSGRFVVQLPVKENILNKLGSSYHQAKRRLLAIERKFKHDHELERDYIAFMREYEELGHMRSVDEARLNISPSYYLPHHAVRKATSTTTKVRVVFDASAKTDTNVSLNDTLRVGPVLQDDIFSILLRFRSFRFGLTADIAKMYRQVIVCPEQRPLQRILWRENPHQKLSTYELSTVTYGTASGSYLAIKAIRTLAEMEACNFPIGSKIILRDFYVDDMISGANDIHEAQIIREQTTDLLKKGGFELRKWCTNSASSSILADCDSDQLVSLSLDDSQDTRTLGVSWLWSSDQFQYTYSNSELENPRYTKRYVLSRLSAIFYPLGLLGPIVILAKIIMQQIWCLKLDWDESLPADLHARWGALENQLQYIKDIKRDRRIIKCDFPHIIELHGFCDASEAAYGACIYVVSQDDQGQRFSVLACAKSRVAPLKTLSIPRLELCGAVLLVNLMTKVKSALPFQIDNEFFWSDSTILLHWISSNSRKFNTFVANRIGEIQRSSPPECWHHVSTESNPADCLSRGLLPTELSKATLWWDGPDWIKQDISNLVQPFRPDSDYDPPEQKVIAMTVRVNVTQGHEIFDRFSSFIRLIRVNAYCYRWVHNKRNPQTKNLSPQLTPDEINDSMNRIIKIVQSDAFKTEIKAIQQENSLPVTSPLRFLNPFLDDQQILRVGGRIRNASIPYSARHQIVLPAKHTVTLLLIKYEHERIMHAGAQATLAAVRLRFWPLSALNVIKSVIHKCITCFRTSPRPQQPIMGNLPASRVERPLRPFISVGTDFCGPFLMKEGLRRCAREFKIYVAVFVCFATKAIHLEMVADLTTEAFLASFKRFISRRGRPSEVYSDNGTNYVGANRELQQMYDLVNSPEQNASIVGFAANESIKWHFIPPRAPHFGGLWEAAVKSFKYLFTRIVKNMPLRQDEFNTLLTQIEAILNSRPLTACSNDPNDLTYLSPGHFLIGDVLTAYPEPSLEHLPIGRLSRWQKVEQIREHFWRRWTHEYLNQCQQLNKWQVNDKIMLEIGQLVIVANDDSPPLSWVLGRIVEVFPGADGIVRTASVKTSNGIYKRAFSKLYILPIND